MSARLGVVYYCTLLCLAEASCIQLGMRVLTVFFHPCYVMDRDFQVYDCLLLQECSDYGEEVLGMSWKKS